MVKPKNLLIFFGFSLIEAMIALGLVGVLTAVVIQLFGHGQQIGQNTQNSVAADQVFDNLNYALTSVHHCSNSLKGRQFRASTINQSPLSVTLNFYDQDFRLVAPAVEVGELNDLRISELTLSLPDKPDNIDFPLGTDQIADGEILLKWQRKTVNAQNIDLPPLKKLVRLFVSTNSSGISTIEKCSTDSTYDGPTIIHPKILVDTTLGTVQSPLIVTANTCQTAIKVEMQSEMLRNSEGGDIYGRFSLIIDGIDDPNHQVEFGAERGGGSGHGWPYHSTLERIFYLTNVNQNIEFLPKIDQVSPGITMDNTFYRISCL